MIGCFRLSSGALLNVWNVWEIDGWLVEWLVIRRLTKWLVDWLVGSVNV